MVLVPRSLYHSLSRGSLLQQEYPAQGSHTLGQHATCTFEFQKYWLSGLRTISQAKIGQLLTQMHLVQGFEWKLASRFPCGYNFINRDFEQRPITALSLQTLRTRYYIVQLSHGWASHLEVLHCHYHSTIFAAITCDVSAGVARNDLVYAINTFTLTVAMKVTRDRSAVLYMRRRLLWLNALRSSIASHLNTRGIYWILER